MVYPSFSLLRNKCRKNLAKKYSSKKIIRKVMELENTNLNLSLSIFVKANFLTKTDMHVGNKKEGKPKHRKRIFCPLTKTDERDII